MTLHEQLTKQILATIAPLNQAMIAAISDIDDHTHIGVALRVDSYGSPEVLTGREAWDLMSDMVPHVYFGQTSAVGGPRIYPTGCADVGALTALAEALTNTTIRDLLRDVVEKQIAQYGTKRAEGVVARLADLGPIKVER